jgi:thiamine kinase-like enzyme
MALTLEEAIARVPQWASASDLNATPLGGGITNHNFRIDVAGEAFVLRITGENTELLGIDRNHEYAANMTAGRLGIAPEVYYFIQPEGYIITRFIDGKAIPPTEMAQPDNTQKVMEAVRKIHNMPVIPGRFDVFKVVRDYITLARSYQVKLPDDISQQLGLIKNAEKAINSLQTVLQPCHNDLLNANFLDAGNIYILDWEYAGMGDPFFDLANFSDHHQLTAEQDRWMLKCYFGVEVSQKQWAHLKIMKIMSDLREAAWGFVQMGISKLDFDFRAYADEFYSRAITNFHHPQWSDYLKEVS